MAKALLSFTEVQAQCLFFGKKLNFRIPEPFALALHFSHVTLRF